MGRELQLAKRMVLMAFLLWPIATAEATSYYFPRRIRLWHKNADGALQVENLDEKFDLSQPQSKREDVIRVAIYISGSKSQTEFIDNFLESFPHLQKLTITTHDGPYPIGRSLPKLAKLDSLNLQSAILEPAVLGACTNLRHLQLRFSTKKRDPNAQPSESLGENLMKLSKLENLELSSFDELDKLGSEDLIRAIQTLPNLKKLVLKYNFLSADALYQWNSAPFASKASLKELHFSYLRLNSEKLSIIAAAMPQFTELTVLNLPGSAVTPEVADVLFPGLSHTIQHLDLSQTTPQDCHSYAHLIDLSRRAPNITTLDLSYSDIGDDGVANLVFAIQEGRLDNITKLLLTRAGITEKGATLLATALPRLSKLDFLSLQENPLGDAGVKLLVNDLRKVTSLQRLDLCQVGISSETTDYIRAQLGDKPGIQIRIEGKESDFGRFSFEHAGPCRVFSALGMKTWFDKNENWYEEYGGWLE
ncbi:MAG: hypothetical protein I8H75_03140 [Myxococcaceae bacterium]|nr:hypothetical protein [Myxococcaceae bacterium]MBH2006325.1 hypothetical protein [Myxococcaceae bacterium]